MRIFDSHVHFVDPDRTEGIVWPPPDSPILGRYLPSDLLDASRPASLSGCIAVETSRRSIDDDWLLRLGRDNSLIEGVVLNLQPDRPGFGRRLQSALSHDKFVGIRFRPIKEYDLESSALHDAIALLEHRRVALEFGAKTARLRTSFATLAARYPETSWILDHCGHPEEGTALSSEWCDGILKIAELENTACKISSKYCDLDTWEPVLKFLNQAFGPKRLLFGSNWPACLPEFDLEKVTSSLRTVFANDVPEVLSSNARRIYRIGDR